MGDDGALAGPRPERTVVPLGDHAVGGGHFAVLAGPTRAAPPDASVRIARSFAGAGAVLLHNGTTSQDDPSDRTSRSEVSLLHRMREETGLPVAAAITDIADIEALADAVDVVQLAGYHMQNYRLLKELGQLDRPVILRRGTANTLDELVSAAEYVLVEGNPNVILCEHGIKTFERLYELTVDFAAVPVLKERTHLPIVVDPTADGRPAVVAALALAAAAAGADGIILEADEQHAARYVDIASRAIEASRRLYPVAG
jgi:3-deoxy-7-phosphoheptulonate synthase